METTLYIFLSTLSGFVVGWLLSYMKSVSNRQRVLADLGYVHELYEGEKDRSARLERRLETSNLRAVMVKEEHRIINNKLALVQDVLGNKPLQEVLIGVSEILDKEYASIPPKAGSTSGCGSHVSGPIGKDGPSVRRQKR